MRWKLIRRRFSISAPRMIVRSHLPWPVRWAVAAIAFGFSAALALWAFEIGKDIAGLDRGTKDDLVRLRGEVQQLRDERDKAQSIANTAESLLKTEKAAQEQLARQLRQVETDNLSLKSDLGFFERLLPAASEGLSIRGLQAQQEAPGQLRYQLIVMVAGKAQPDFNGRYEMQLTGMLDGKPWTFLQPGAPRALQFRQYTRVEGMIDFPPQASVRTLRVRVLDNAGGVRSVQTIKL